MSQHVEFFFDYGSPFSYLADTQLTALARRTGATAVYRPMLLGAVLKETGNASPLAVPAKGRYMSVELQRWAKHYGVPFVANKFFPINTLRLMRGAVAAQQEGCFAVYHRALYAAFWVDNANLGEPEVIRSVLGKAGLNANLLLTGIEEPDVKEQLRLNTEEAVRRGVFGAPTFFVGEEMFWGNDRLTFVEEALTRS
ncbi:MAG TPA: 2-hydroxychromene-2-carboxylate isomerase [Candidatus Binatia bacterium]|jgi:2-hydroxychromene-2-carboxylate isomerase|nr:2-hydroxychromene-2-carboxylate isomerase [Candidatus Binatia bacterium]